MYPIAIPQHWEDPDELRRFLGRAEELGYPGAWTQEHILGKFPMLGPLETLAFAAACTRKMRLGCAVLLAPHYSPPHLAKSLSSLDVLSGGRLEIGLVAGGPNRPLEAFGITRDRLITRFHESVELMKAFWTRPVIDFEGHFYKVRQAAMEPKPLQKPHPPLWYGGNARAALERAAHHADGFIGAGSITTEKFRQHVQLLREQPRRIRIAKRVYVHLDDSYETARQIMADRLQALYGTDLVKVAVVGPPESVIAGLREVLEAGAEMLVLNPLAGELEHLERLQSEVLPHL